MKECAGNDKSSEENFSIINKHIQAMIRANPQESWLVIQVVAEINQDIKGFCQRWKA